MHQEYDVTVVITTFNRSQMLPAALESMLHQEPGNVRYEVIVVDNNSTDGTKQIVERYITQGHRNLKYMFEPRQGVSHARNRGVINAHAPIIAFSDDDVRVAKDWIANIKREFDEHPEVDYVGGKILPHWKTEPPAWLNRDHWWALALLDYGDEPFYVNADNPLCLPTANASFRCELFKRFGLFSPEFSGREDHEFLLRLWRAGSRGLYSPTVIVTAEVQNERLKKNYHRRWNTTTGRFNSLMRLNEIMGPDGRIVGELPNQPTLFGVPGFVYRGLIEESLGLVAATLSRRKAAALRNKNAVWYLIGYITKRYEQDQAHRKHSGIYEIGLFVKSLLNKKVPKPGSGSIESISQRATRIRKRL
jgi:glycosyltransferase involved in cell wall biosynthesis